MTSYPEDPPGEDELRPLADEVSNEFRVFWWAAAEVEHPALTADHADPYAAITRMALTEVFLLHLRNIVDFFKAEPQKDDVVASHYAPDWKKAVGGDDLAWLVERTPSINKRLHHVTAYRRRVDHTVDTFFFAEARDKVDRVLTLFLSCLSDERRHWFSISI